MTEKKEETIDTPAEAVEKDKAAEEVKEAAVTTDTSVEEKTDTDADPTDQEVPNKSKEKEEEVRVQRLSEQDRNAFDIYDRVHQRMLGQ